MIKSERSKIQLKKLIQQQTITSQLDHPLGLQSKLSPLELPNNEPLDMNAKFIDCTFNLDINSKFTQNNLQLKLQSKVISNEIDCLHIESKIKTENDYGNKNLLFHQFLQEPQIQFRKSLVQQQSGQKPKFKPLKVHSSIDGMQGSKKQHKQSSLPISDLILSDNMYMKLSSRLNQHQNFSSKQENQHLSNLFQQNLQVLKQQNFQLQSLLMTEMKLLEMKFLEDTLKEKIKSLELSIDQLRQNCYMSPASGSSGYLSHRGHKSRSRTPQNVRILSPKSINTPRALLNRKNILQNKIKNQNQKIKEQRDKSVKVVQKLSQAKSDYQKITDKLSQYSSRLHHINDKSQKYSQVVSPLSQVCKSPSRKSNIRKKYDQFFKNQIKNYHKTLKQHCLVIHEQIETFKAYEMAKVEQLKEEINLLKNEIRFVEVKSVGKLIFGDLQKRTQTSTKITDLSKKSSTSPINTKAFDSNFSQNILRTVSPIPSLSPRSPQIYSKSPQTYRNSPQLVKRYTEINPKSPKVYSTKSPYYCNRQFDMDSQGSMTPRSIKIKDMNILRNLDDTKSRGFKQSGHKQIMRKKQYKLDMGLYCQNSNVSDQTKLSSKSKKLDRGKENVNGKMIGQRNTKQLKNNNKRCFKFKSEKTNGSQFTSPQSKNSIQTLR